MGRLTEWDEYGNADIIALSDVMPEIYAELSFSETNDLTDVLNRLASYEDTGLEPDEIKEHEAAYIEIMTRTYGPLHQKISQWLQAEKDGRLVVLPCKVGDEVYFPATGRWDAATICNIELTSIGVRFGWVQCDVGPEVNELWDDGCFLAEDIGKTVFLTREEAETALKKGEET